MPVGRMDDEEIPEQARFIRQRNRRREQAALFRHRQQAFAHAVLPEPQKDLRAGKGAVMFRRNRHAAPAGGCALRTRYRSRREW